ncbi:MAG: TonB-dependent receptor [Pseudomonadota bacterium]
MILSVSRSAKSALLLGGSAAVLAFGSTGAMAQDADLTNGPDQELNLEEETSLDEDRVIIVTGQKIQRSLQDTQASVAVVNQQAIQDANFRDVYDVLNQTANVASLFDGAGFSIRGLRNTGAGSGESTSDVASIFVDGVFIPSSLLTNGAFSIWDAQSVEVFRGPQSTIQGRNSLAGAVVIRTVDPGSEFSGDFQVEASEFNTFRGSAALTVPIAPGQVSLRLAGDYQRSDGFQNNTFLDRDDIDESEAITGRATLLVTPDFAPDLTIRGTFTYSDNSEGENRVVEELFRQDGQRTSIQNNIDRQGAEAYIASGEISYDFSDEWSLTSVTSYIDSSSFFNFDPDNSNPAITGLNDELQVNMSDDRIFTQELRLTYDGDGISGLLGGYFFDNKGSTDSDNSTVVGTDFAFPQAPTLAGLLFMTQAPTPAQIAQANAIRQLIVSEVPSFPVQLVRQSSTDVQNFAVFGEVTIDITDRLHLTLGARYDREEVQQTVFDATIVPNLTVGNPLIDPVLLATQQQFSTAFTFEADNDFEAFLPKAGIVYDFSDDVSLGFTYQRAYRAGALSFNTFRAALAPEGSEQAALEEANIVNSFDPEFTNNYELSFRSVWGDGSFVLNANAYIIDYTDQQILVQLTPNPLDTITDNAGRSRLLGFEIEATMEPTEGLTLFANLGYSETEFTEASAVIGGDITGFEFAYAPDVTIGLGGRYEHSSGFYTNLQTRLTDGNFTSVIDLNRSAPSIPERIQQPTGFNDAAFTVDLNVGWEGDYFGVEVFARNLFDEEFFTFDPINDPVDAVNSPGGPFIPNDITTALVGAPRQFGVRITGSF